MSAINAILSWLAAAWTWMCSDEACNFGSFLSGIGTLLLILLALIWVSQKRAEKKSDVAEHAMDNLYSFLDEIKTWLLYANSWIIYNRHSEANTLKQKILTEEKKIEFRKNLDNDKYEVTNYCRLGNEIIKILPAIIYRAQRLSDSTINEKLDKLYEHVRKLPYKLSVAHFINTPQESKDAAKEYLRNSSDLIEKDCSAIHDLLMDHLMFRKKRKIKS